MNIDRNHGSPESGYSLLELAIVMVVLAVGILALARLFPGATREQVHDRMRTSASYFVQEKVETLRGLQSNDPDLVEGRHPASGTESVGTSGVLQRHYTVTAMDEPLENLKLVSVAVTWQTPRGLDSIVTATYVDR